MLIQKHKIPHNKNKAINPVTKEATGVWGIRAATKKATIAILHQGKYKHAQKLKSMVRIIEIVNFIKSFVITRIKTNYTNWEASLLHELRLITRIGKLRFV